MSRAILEKLWNDGKDFVTAEELDKYCQKLRIEYTPTIHYLLKTKRLTRVFRGVFRARSLEEIKRGKTRYNHLEVVAHGLEIKKVKRWYFGLHTALKLNNMTHEYFTIDNVISDSVFRPRPIKIEGYKVGFTKVTPRLFSFGVKRNGMVCYSDPEKTILDFIYLSRQQGKDERIIVMDVADWSEGISSSKIRRYARYYPKTVKRIMEELIK